MDLEVRVSTLESDMAQMRDEWAVVAQAPLIQARLLNALRQTQVEHGQVLLEHSRKQEQIVGMLTTLIERDSD